MTLYNFRFYYYRLFEQNGMKLVQIAIYCQEKTAIFYFHVLCSKLLYLICFEHILLNTVR